MDIRLIKDKITNEFKEFAFVEFPTIEIATNAFTQFTLNPVTLNGQDITVDFSKLRSIDEKNKFVDKQAEINVSYCNLRHVVIMITIYLTIILSILTYTFPIKKSTHYPIINNVWQTQAYSSLYSSLL